MRQNPDSYDPEKDSPLIGGHPDEFSAHVEFAAEPAVGWGPYVRTADLIVLLEKAVEEFPKSKTAIDASEFTYKYYEEDSVEEWKKKWLTVPPV